MLAPVRTAVVMAMLWTALNLAGCDTTGPGGSREASRSARMSNALAGGGATRLTETQLQASLMAFADRFMSRAEEAANGIQAQTTDPVLRQRAQTAKYYPSLGVVTIAADPDPAAALLDMLAMVTLQNAVWQTWAPATFGPELAAPLVAAGADMEDDIWSIGAKVLNDEQQQALRDLITTWRSEHLDETYVAMVRFDDFMLLRGETSQRRSKALLEFNIVSGVDETARQVRQARIFGERAMFLAARMPLLLAWQTQLVAYDFALQPEVTQVLANLQEFTTSTRQVSEDINRLPQQLREQTEATMNMLDERQDRLDALVSNTRAGIADAERLAGTVGETAVNMREVASEVRAAADALNELVHSTDQLIARFEPAPGATSQPDDARPFDINEYTQAIKELSVTAKDLTAMVQQTDSMLNSEAFSKRLEEVDEAAGRRLEQLDRDAAQWLDELNDRAKSISDRTFVRGVWLIGIGCAGALAVALIYRLLAKRKA